MSLMRLHSVVLFRSRVIFKKPVVTQVLRKSP
jgi:hypothetical protein